MCFLFKYKKYKSQSQKELNQMDKKEKIVMLRLVGGEFLIGKLDEAIVVDENSNVQDNGNKINLEDARVFSIQMTGRGAAIGLLPLFPFTKSEIKALGRAEIDKSIVIQVVDENYIDGEILNAYKSNVSGIDMSAANKGIII